MTDLQRAIAARDVALRQATGVDPNYPDPGEKGISPTERSQRARKRLDAWVRYNEAAAQARHLEAIAFDF